MDGDELELEDRRSSTAEPSESKESWTDLERETTTIPATESERPGETPRKGKRRSRWISKRADWMYEDLDKKPIEKNADSTLVFPVRVVGRFGRRSAPRELLVDLENEKMSLHKSPRYPIAGAHFVDALLTHAEKIHSATNDKRRARLIAKHERRIRLYFQRVRGAKSKILEFDTVDRKNEFVALLSEVLRSASGVPKTTGEYQRRSAALSQGNASPDFAISAENQKVWKELELLPGEVLGKTFHASTLFVRGETLALSGSLSATNYRVLFSKYKHSQDVVDSSGKIYVSTGKNAGERPHEIFAHLDAKYSEIRRIDFVNSSSKSNDDSLIHLVLRNGSSYSLGVGDANSSESDEPPRDASSSSDRVAKKISNRVVLKELWSRHRHSDFACVHYNTSVFHKHQASKVDGWSVFDANAEYARVLGNIVKRSDRDRTTVFFNKDYELSPTYPLHFMVPTSFGMEEDLEHVAKFRSRRRVPATTWIHPRTGATLSRSSQPLPGLKGKRSPHDEALVRALEAQNAPGIYVVDARGVGAAFGNQIARGKGPENPLHYDDATLLFMGIGNIHTMRGSYEKFTGCLQDPKLAAKQFHSKAANWLGHVRQVLIASTRVAEILSLEGKSVLVHCSDGWDRTSQITSLASMVHDSYYRTLRGFVVLVEKEFMSFGFKFGDRHGFSGSSSEDEVSPIFLQFLEATNQMIRTYPTAFQFSPRFLVDLALRRHDSRYGSFLDNTEKTRVRKRKHKTFSIWDDFLNDSSYLNRSYVKREDPLWPDLRASKTAVWEEVFVDSVL